MASPINTPLTSEIWHLSIDDLLQPLPESPRLGGTGPFVINLSASTAPISQPMKSLADCPSAHVYQIQRTEDHRLRYRLRLGPFDTEDEADSILGQVRDIYPSALTATADMDDLRAIGTLQAKSEAQKQLAAAKSKIAASPVPAPSIAALRAAAATAESSVASASPPAATPSVLPAAEPAAKAAGAPIPAAVVAPLPVAAPKPLRVAPEPVLTERVTVSSEPAARTTLIEPMRHAAGSIPVLSDSVEVIRRPVARAPTAPVPEGSAVRVLAPPVLTAPPVAATPVVVAAPAVVAAPPAAAAAAVVAAAPAAAAPAVIAAPSVSQVIEMEFTPPPAEPAAAAPVAPSPPVLPLVSPKAPPLIAAKKPAGIPRRVQEIVPPAHVSAPTRKVSSPPGIARVAAAPAVAAPRMVRPPPASAAPIGSQTTSLSTPRPDLESTQTLRPLTPLELQGDPTGARWFVIQLSLSEESFDPDSLPNLDIFNEYRLYCVAGLDQDKVMHALRVGFFTDEGAAAMVASYLGAFYEKPTIKRISVAERERFADQRVEARKDIGATGRHAVIEITNERVVREKRTSAAAPTAMPGRPAPVLPGARKGH